MSTYEIVPVIGFPPIVAPVTLIPGLPTQVFRPAHTLLRRFAARPR